MFRWWSVVSQEQVILVYGMITHWVIDSADAAVETRREKKSFWTQTQASLLIKIT